MYLACYTQSEIAEEIELSQQAVDKELKLLLQMENVPKVVKLSAEYNVHNPA